MGCRVPKMCTGVSQAPYWAPSPLPSCTSQHMNGARHDLKPAKLPVQSPTWPLHQLGLSCQRSSVCQQTPSSTGSTWLTGWLLPHWMVVLAKSRGIVADAAHAPLKPPSTRCSQVCSFTQPLLLSTTLRSLHIDQLEFTITSEILITFLAATLVWRCQVAVADILQRTCRQ